MEDIYFEDGKLKRTLESWVNIIQNKIDNYDYRK